MGKYCRDSGLLSGPSAVVRAAQRAGPWVAGGLPEKVKASGAPSSSYGVSLRGRSSGSSTGPHRPWPTGLGSQHPQINCLPSLIPKALNSSHHSSLCCRTSLRPQNVLQGPLSEIIYILLSHGFVLLSLMTASISFSDA